MTTTFQTALQSGDYTKLRGATANNSWWARQFITLCKNTVVFQALAADTIAISSFAQIPYNTVSVGAYTDIEIGETFFLSHTSDIRDAYYRGRIRKDATSGLINVNETSVNILAGDFIFVVYDFDVWDVLSRMVGTTQYEDYDLTFVPLPPITAGLQTAYVNYDPTDAAYRIAFDVSSSYATDQASTASLTFQFTFVAGTYTVFSGALNTAVVTVDFDANTEQWGKLVITDSQGTVTTRRFYIRAHGSTDTPALDFSGAQITGSIDNGWNATVSAWNGVSSTLNQTFTVIWSQEYYNATLGPLSIANNIDMVGRFHHETNSGRGDAIYGYVTDVKFDIEGVCTQLQRLQQQDLTTIYKTTASAWDEISLNTPQRSIIHYMARHSTVLSLCDLTFPNGIDVTNLFQYVPNQGGNGLDAVRSIAAQINANVEFAPDGRIQIVRDTRFLVDKSGVVVVGDFTTADFTTTDIPVDPVNKVGRLDAFGASFNASNTAAFRSRAPGSAQNYAAGQATLDNQILMATSHATLARAELNYRAGQQMQIENLTYSQDWKATTGGYHFLIPSRGQRVTHTLPTTTNTRGLAFTDEDFWQIVSISINHNNADGSRDVQTHEELEPPVGDSGDTVPQIAGGTQTNPILLQPLDPFPALPDDPGNYLPDDPTPNPYPSPIPQKSSTVIYSDGTIVDTSRQVTTNRTPPWTGITPDDLGSFEVRDLTFDRTTLSAPIGAYLIVSDGTDSKILHTADAFATPVVWDVGASFAGEYTQIRSAGTSGSVLVYSPDSSSTTTVYDFLTSDGGFVQNPAGPVGAWSLGVGWSSSFASFGGGDNRGVQIQLTIASSTVIKLKAHYSITVGNLSGTALNRLGTDVNGSLATQYQPATGDGTFDIQWTGSESGVTILYFTMLCGANPGGGGDPGGTLVLTRYEVTTSGGNGGVRYSSDYGATVGSALSLGSSPGGSGGFDLELIGAASLAAASGQVMIATTLGGAYSNAAGGTLSSGQPVALALPYRRFPHGATQYSATDPDYLLVGDTAIATASVWKVNGATGVRTDITPVASATGIGANTITVYQTSSICYILVIINVSGAYELHRSLDAGATWSLSRTCVFPTYMRYSRNNPAVVYLLDGATLYVSLNHGASWLADTLPSTNTGALDMYS